MTGVLPSAAALLGLSLTLSTAVPTGVAGLPDPAPAQIAAMAGGVTTYNSWVTSYPRDTTRAITLAAAGASKAGAAALPTAPRVSAARPKATTRPKAASGATAAGAAAAPGRLGISCTSRSWPMAVKSRITSLFGVSQIGGYRPGGGDHSAGLALDVMVGRNKVLGDRVARWTQANARALNVKYVIWYQRIWTPGQSSDGWRRMSDRGGATANHIDHVHISFKPGRGACG